MLCDFAVPQLDTDNDSVKQLMATPVHLAATYAKTNHMNDNCYNNDYNETN